MYNFNLTNTTVLRAEKYIVDNWVNTFNPGFVKEHVLVRGAYFILGPASLITSAIDIIIGLGVGIGVICTLGKHKPTLQMALNHLGGSGEMISLPYINLLKALNPKAKFNNLNFTINAAGDGFITDYVRKYFKNITRNCYNSDNLLKKHVGSRLTYALLLIASLVIRAVDGVIGITAAALSFLTLGKFESLNNLAYRSLQVTGIINDLFYSTIKFINPWTRTSKA